MQGKSINFIKGGILVVAILLGATHSAYSQVVHAGLKGGVNASWVRYYEPEFRKNHDVEPVIGFNAGAAFSFKVKERYFLHTELLYTTKGRITTGDLELRDRVRYNYIEIPLTYNIYFKGRINGTRQFKWYAGVGPNFSYWLGGRGRISHFELRDFEVDGLDYKLKFGERPENAQGDSEVVYVKNPNRLQLGLNVGGGIFVEPIGNRKIMVDVRFELGHSWLGTTESTDFVFPASYEDNLRTRNMGLRLSLMYLLESNTAKSTRNKGKSTINPQTGKKRRR